MTSEQEATFAPEALLTEQKIRGDATTIVGVIAVVVVMLVIAVVAFA